MNRTNILTTGCSFTDDPVSWANYLKNQYDTKDENYGSDWQNRKPYKHYRLKNVGNGGSGNLFNFRRASLELLKNDYDLAIFQLSGINRFELILAEENHKALANTTKDEPDHPHVVKKEKYTWIKSTGDYEWWSVKAWMETTTPFDYNERKVKNFCGKFIKNYRMYVDNIPYRLLETLTAIVNLQTICKQRNVKPLFFSWKKEIHNEWYQKVIEQNPSEIGAWWDQIDWDNWWFYNDTGGLAEWGIDNGYTGALHEDHTNNPPQGWSMIDNKKTMIGHPSAELHQAFAEKIIKPWIEKND